MNAVFTAGMVVLVASFVDVSNDRQNLLKPVIPYFSPSWQSVIVKKIEIVGDLFKALLILSDSGGYWGTNF